MATTRTEDAGAPWSGDDGGDDENGDRCHTRGEERDRSGVIGRLSDQREEGAEPEACADTEHEWSLRRTGHADVTAGNEPDRDRSDASPAIGHALGRSPSDTPTATGTIAAITALSGLTSRLGPSASPW